MFKQSEQMDSKQYITNKLQELHSQFPLLTIKYKYDSYTQMHIVDIMPLDEYDNNAEYKSYETELGFEFDSLFFPESLMFISSESLTQITCPELKIEPVIKTSIINEAHAEISEEIFYTIKSFNFNNAKETNNYSLAA